MNHEDILKLCDVVTEQKEEFLLNIGCRIRTTSIPLLPRKNKSNFVIPYGNKTSVSIPAILNTELSLAEITCLAKPGQCGSYPLITMAQIAYQNLQYMIQEKKVKTCKIGGSKMKYIWIGPKPKTRVKVLEIPQEAAMKLLFLGSMMI